jgi:3-oxoadipate enol-lactonase
MYDTQRRSGFVDVGTATLYYEEQGQGTPVIMVHGGGLDRRSWDAQFDVLAEHYRAIRYDARCHGRSKNTPGVFSHHEDLFHLMKDLGLSKAVIMGLSLGGYVAIDFALAHPEMVLALIPVSPGLTGYEFKSKANLEYEAKMRRVASIDEAVDVFMQYWTDGPSRTPDQVDPAVRDKVRQIEMESFPTYLSGMGQSPEERLQPPAVERLAEIDVPTCVIVGDIDMPDIHEVADIVTEGVTASKKTVISGAAHLVNMERPEEFNATVLDFLSTVASPQSAQGPS